ncbi:MAG: polysaccharide export protein [Sulfuricurvum sp.]|jgi:polysaccharide export outer membrane protein|uniref:polysaccharide biosynthesis/export family protein n=1 Tax=Sulfuricurvum sp. TaxID=2025608 RepID=UPI0025F57514|nr:polysaccharide biosynthesis/export family protein [Sulfuricurvum sp.]MCK9372295.1 polysaccharide export protein [Sulfuricurvum sp.]
MLKKFLLLAIVVLLTGCATKQDYTLFQTKPIEDSKQEGDSYFFKKNDTKNDRNDTAPQKMISEYKIAPRDKLSIVVFNHPELSTRSPNIIPTGEKGITVSSDGTVMLALIGRIALAGLTKEEAGDLVTKRYNLYIKDPYVNLEILNQRVYVVGEVNRPGVVPLINESMTVIEAIAQAGDFNVYSQRNSVKIMRGNLSNPTISTIDMTKLASLEASNYMLYPGDTVYVQPNSMRATNVNINEYLPALQLINSLITPFVNVKYLTN